MRATNKQKDGEADSGVGVRLELESADAYHVFVVLTFASIVVHKAVSSLCRSFRSCRRRPRSAHSFPRCRVDRHGSRSTLQIFVVTRHSLLTCRRSLVRRFP